jgi:hypothetical protein
LLKTKLVLFIVPEPRVEKVDDDHEIIHRHAIVIYTGRVGRKAYQQAAHQARQREDAIPNPAEFALKIVVVQHYGEACDAARMTHGY